MVRINIDDALNLMHQGEREFKFIVEPNMIDKARMFLTGKIHKGVELYGIGPVEIFRALGFMMRYSKEKVHGNSKNIISDFSLSQNYPNPFNPSTIISYSLPVSGQVTLKVFEILGREVAMLVNEQKEAGTYTVKYDASSLPSGIYFYQLQTGNFVETRKIVLQK